MVVYSAKTLPEEKRAKVVSNDTAEMGDPWVSRETWILTEKTYFNE